MFAQAGFPHFVTVLGRKRPLKHLVLGFSLLFAVGLSPLKLGVVAGRSMSPSLTNGEFYLMDRSYFRGKPIQRNEIIVFHQDGGSYIKRVAGVPGDTIYLVRYRDGGQDELVPGWQLSRLRRAVTRPPWNRSMKLVEVRVNEGQYFVLGDNLPDSVDSRSFGMVDASAIQGRVLFAPPVITEAPLFAGFSEKRSKS